jgi:hypothetical protein
MYECPRCRKKSVPITGLVVSPKCRSCGTRLRLKSKKTNFIFLIYFGLVFLINLWTGIYLGPGPLLGSLLTAMAAFIQGYFYEFEEVTEKGKRAVNLG